MLFSFAVQYRMSAQNPTAQDLQPKKTGLPGRTVWALATNASAGSGTTSVTTFAATDKGLWRSGDNGTSWTETSLKNIAVYAVKSRDIGKTTTLLVGTDRGVLRSTDGGNSWASPEVTTGTVSTSNIVALKKVFDIEVVGVGTASAWFAATEKGVYRSNNDGRTWSLVNIDRTADNNEVRSITVDGNTVIVNLWKEGLWRSTNSGNSWTKLTIAGETSLAKSVFAHTGRMWVQQGNKATTATVSMLFVGAVSGNLWRSTDNGSTWTKSLAAGTALRSALSTPTGVDVLTSAGTALISGTPTGLAVSNDNGTTWQSFRTSLPQPISLVSDSKNLYVGVQQSSTAMLAEKGASSLNDAAPGVGTFTTPAAGQLSCAVPSVNSFTPPSVIAGGSAMTVTINGSNFESETRYQIIVINEITGNQIYQQQLTSGNTIGGIGVTYNNSHSSTLSLSSTILATTSRIGITPYLPSGCGAQAGPGYTFYIDFHIPTLSSIAPTTFLRGSPNSPSATISGANFEPGAKVYLYHPSLPGGKFALATTFVDANTLQTAWSIGIFYYIGAASSVEVGVENPSGGVSPTRQTLSIVNPAPAAGGLSIAQISAGTSSPLVISGLGYYDGSQVYFDGQPKPSTFSNGNLTINLVGSDIPVARLYSVVVVNPAPGGGSTQPMSLNVVNPTPSITAFSPSPLGLGEDATLTLSGGGSFVSGAVAILYPSGTELATTFVNENTLTVSVPGSLITTVSETNYSIRVRNPTPGGGLSAPVTVPVRNGAPSLSGVSPNSLVAAAQDTPLTLTGGNFLSGASVLISGPGLGLNTPLTTTVVNANTITATLPAGIAASVGQYSLIVRNPNSVADSPAQNINIVYPQAQLSSVTPSPIPAQNAAQALTLSGTNFVSGAQVRIQDEATNGQTVNQLLSASVINSSQINATLPQTLAERVGRYRLTVDNPSPNAGVSGTVNVDVLALTPTFAALSTTFATMTGAAQTLTLTGTNFVNSAQNGTIIEVNGQPIAPPVAANVLSATQISLTLPVTLLDSARVLTIRIVNPALTINGTPQGGGASVTRTFTLLNPAPALSGIAPQVVTANPVSPTPLVLTLTGTNVTASSRVLVQRTGTTTVDTLQATPNTLVGGLATSLALTLPAPLFTDATTFTLRVLTPYGSIPLGFTSGGVSAPQTLTVQNPLPSITTLTPAQSLILQTTTVTITGTNFVQPSAVNNQRGTVAYFGATALPTSVLSPTSVQVTIASALLTVAQNYSITVRNPLVNGLGGGTSNAATFTALNPTALLDSIVVPSSGLPNGGLPLVVSSATRTVNVFGQFFVNGVNITLSRTGGNAVAPQTLSTTFVSPTQVTLVIPTAFLAELGTLSFQAANPNPTGGASNTLSTAIVNPRPRLFTLTPTTATISASDIALTLDGGNFLPNSTIVVRGTTQGGADTTITLAPTGYTPANATPTRLTVSVPTTFAALAGTYFVWVQNPAPTVSGNTNSDTLSFFMRNPLPSLTSVTPATVSTGSGDTTVTLVGLNFTPLASVLLNGATLAANRVVIQDRTTILATIPAALMAQATTLNVQVTIPAPGGGTSVVRTLTVRNAAPVLDSIAPATIAAMRDTVITAYGSGFNLTSQFRLIRGTTTVTLAIVSLPSSGVARLAISSSAIVTLATYQVRVFNSAPGGGTSVVRNLVVQGGVPVSMEFLNVTTSIIAGASITSVQARFRDALGVLSDIPLVAPMDSLYAVRLPDSTVSDTIRKGMRFTRISTGLYSIPNTVFTTAGTYTLSADAAIMTNIAMTIGRRNFTVRPTIRANVWIEFFNSADSAITSLTATTSLAKLRLAYRDRFQNLTDSAVGIVRLLTVTGNPWGASTATLTMQRTATGLYNLAAPLPITTAGTYYVNPAGLSRTIVATTAMDSLMVSPAAPTAYIRALRQSLAAGTSQPALTVVFRDGGSNRIDLAAPRLTAVSLDTLPGGTRTELAWTLTRTALGTYTAPALLFTQGGEYVLRAFDDTTPMAAKASGFTSDSLFTVGAAAATRLEIATADTLLSPFLPDTVRAGASLPRLRFLFRDASGNPTDIGVTLTSATYRVAVGVSTGTLRLERESVGTYWLSSTQASVFATSGTYTISVRNILPDSMTVNGILPGRRTFVVAPGAAWAVLFTSVTPAFNAGGNQAAFRLQFRDALGNAAPVELTEVQFSNATSSSIPNTGAIALSQTGTGAYTAAVTPFTVSGAYTLAVNLPNVQALGTSAFTVRALTTRTVEFSDVPDTLWTAQPLPPVLVRFRDIYGNLTNDSRSVTFTKTGSPASTGTVALNPLGTGVYTTAGTVFWRSGNYTLSVSGIAAANSLGKRTLYVRSDTLYAMRLDSISPQVMALADSLTHNWTVHIFGEHFSPASYVVHSFNSLPFTTTFVSENELLATLPQNLRELGLVMLEVRSPGSSVNLPTNTSNAIPIFITDPSVEAHAVMEVVRPDAPLLLSEEQIMFAQVQQRAGVQGAKAVFLNRQLEMLLSPKLHLALMDGIEATIVMGTPRQIGAGDYTVSGYVENDTAHSSVHIAITDNKYVGLTTAVNGISYRIEPLGDRGLHIITKLDPTFASEGECGTKGGSGSSLTSGPAITGCDNRTIRLLYIALDGSDLVRPVGAVTGIKNNLQAQLSRANLIYNRSLIWTGKEPLTIEAANNGDIVLWDYRWEFLEPV